MGGGGGGGGGVQPKQLEWETSTMVVRWPALRSSVTAGLVAGAGLGHGVEDSGQARASTWSSQGEPWR
jgi:hypothetical protein